MHEESSKHTSTATSTVVPTSPAPPFPIGLVAVAVLLSAWRLSMPGGVYCGIGLAENVPWELLPLGSILLLAGCAALPLRRFSAGASKCMRAGVWIVLGAMVVIHGLDVSISNSFADRFRLLWISKFWRESRLIAEIIARSYLVLGLAVFAMLAAVRIRLGSVWPARVVVAATGILAAAFVFELRSSSECFRRPLVLRLILSELLEKDSSADSYPQDMMLAATERYRAQSRFSGVPENRSIIVVLMESLSSSHSARVSGLKGIVPDFDELSEQGRLFTNFFSNYVDSEGGLVALLSAVPPLEILGGSAFLHRDYASLPSVVSEMKRRGYQTEFLASTPIGFLQKVDYLHGIGFDLANGRDEVPRFIAAPRFAFASPSDEVLYEELLERVGLRRAAGRPFFFVTVTGSSHLPWHDPRGKRNSEASVMGYSAERLKGFVEKLRATGYLDSGYLLIMGDHRAMTPISEEELNRFGESAIGRVPLLILGPGIEPGQIDTRFFQEADLFPKLAEAIDSDAPLSPYITFVTSARSMGPIGFRSARTRQVLIFAESDGGRHAGVANLVGAKIDWRVQPPQPLNATTIAEGIQAQRAAQHSLRFGADRSCAPLGVGMLPDPGQRGIRVAAHENGGQFRPIDHTPPIFTTTWTHLKQPNLQTLIPGHPTNFTLQLNSYFEAPADGRYLFSFLVDDGLCLFIDGQLVVDATVLGSGYPVESAVQLTKGLHEFELQLFQLGGVASISADWVQPKFNSEFDGDDVRVPIPPERFVLPSPQ